ncbi:MAG: SDR family NAD(P)-dependent oxidoreductase [Actinomycetia bacterium]|nr:SDR family NAD(P)-dependent oxidoreductase [Actinomycetes bacterium]MCH9761959.1 SDR family NAD(P)-dependent oxidoreductase [Actinomycetes bacterium]
MQFDGKRVVITGGSSGIGLAMARAFAAEGADVTITGRTESRLNEAASSHPSISGVVCDVANDGQVVALLDAVDSQGGVDILINNAGVMLAFDVTKGLALESQLHEIAIDAAGPVRLVHHFLPHMLTRPSVLVNVSSGLAYVPYAAAPVYSASKAFLHSYTQSLRAQLAGTSVRVVELLPPVVDTPMATQLDASFKKMPPDKLISAFLKDLKRGKDEIVPGQSALLKWLSRFAPPVIFGQLNKNPRG